MHFQEIWQIAQRYPLWLPTWPDIPRHPGEKGVFGINQVGSGLSVCWPERWWLPNWRWAGNGVCSSSKIERKRFVNDGDGVDQFLLRKDEFHKWCIVRSRHLWIWLGESVCQWGWRFGSELCPQFLEDRIVNFSNRFESTSCWQENEIDMWVLSMKNLKLSHDIVKGEEEWSFDRLFWDLCNCEHKGIVAWCQVQVANRKRQTNRNSCDIRKCHVETEGDCDHRRCRYPGGMIPIILW
jgi:hypothetical protein